MRINRLFALLISICLLAGLCCVPVYAETVVTGSCGDNATWTFDASTGTLTISGTGPMNCKTYSTGGPWNAHLEEIRHIVIEEGITTVIKSAFSNHWLVKSVKIADSVKTIERSAFFCCEALTDLCLGTGVTSIGEMAFNSCWELKNVELPASLQILGIECFSNTGLVEIAIPEGIKTIDDGAFRATALARLYLPASVSKINYAAFGSCAQLKNIYYGGTEEQWAGIDIDNTIEGGDSVNKSLFTATIYDNHKHSFGGGKITREANCTQKGIKTYTCTACGAGKQEIFSGKHIWDSGKITKATCTKDGAKVFNCTVCKETKTETIAAAGHKWDNGTQTADTTVRYSCKNCTAVKTEGTPVISSPTEVTTPSAESDNTTAPAEETNFTENTISAEAEATVSDSVFEEDTVFPWGIVVGIFLAVLAGGGAGVYFWLKKQKR